MRNVQVAFVSSVFDDDSIMLRAGQPLAIAVTVTSCELDFSCRQSLGINDERLLHLHVGGHGSCSWIFLTCVFLPADRKITSDTWIISEERVVIELVEVLGSSVIQLQGFTVAVHHLALAKPCLECLAVSLLGR